MEALRESRTKSRKKREEIVSNEIQNQHIYKYCISMKYKILSKIVSKLCVRNNMPIAFPCFPVASAGVIGNCSRLQILFVV